MSMVIEKGHRGSTSMPFLYREGFVFGNTNWTLHKIAPQA